MAGDNGLLSALAMNPAVILTVGAVLGAFVPNGFAAIRRPLMLVFVAMSAFQLQRLGLGEYGALSIFGEPVTMLRIDPLSRIFAVVFHIAAALNLIYAWRSRDRAQDFATLAYPAAALGGVLAGDLVTLFVWWELAAMTSAFFVLGPGTRATFLAAMRYLTIQILSGVLLLAGIVLVYRETGSLAFGEIGLRDGAGAIKMSGLVMLLAFGIKAAFPLLHNWVQDSYPKADFAGTIVLSVFTTKLAVASLARAFPGTGELVYIGAVMTIFPIFFALIENDLKKVLCYSINNQIGFMVIGIGFGTAASMNGAVGYAFTNIIFESLLFMAVGAAIYRTGTSKATELGGLYRTMPVTMVFCIIGAMSISAFPGFAGFVTKGLIIDAAGEAHAFWIWLVLLFASAGVLEHAGIKIPYFTFFAHDSARRPKEAPPAMLIAMGISAFLCIAIGVYPEPLYALMPYPEALADYHPYAPYHVVEQLQLLLWAVLAFAVLILIKWYPAEVPSANLDTDWFYRVPGRDLFIWAVAAVRAIWRLVWRLASTRFMRAMDRIYAVHGPEGAMARSWPTGFMALATAVVLGLALFIAFIS
ncbi:MAG: Na(+)/H(+) antiporter subunit D [Parvularculaceae bacterium]|nr:Na(+)/H(+) antiporter subunit D [Parvularculaceae bacterium]